MNNFLYKELKLCLSPINWLFLSFPLMLLIPNYPCYVPYFYTCLSSFFIFNNGELNKDMQYSLVLPIKKGDIVKSRCLLIFAYEVASIILGIPLALISVKVIGAGNAAGIDPNVAFFGLLCIPLTLFHFVFFTNFYKKGEKPGFSFLFGSIAFFASYIILEFPVWLKNISGIEFFQLLDNVDTSSQIKQLPVLVCGIIIYLLGWLFTYKISMKNFEKVDL